MSYSYMTLGTGYDSGYLTVAEVAYHAGVNLYQNPKFKKFLDGPFRYCFLNLTFPANGDCGCEASLWVYNRTRSYEKPYLRYNDPKYGWLLSHAYHNIKPWLERGEHCWDLLAAGKGEIKEVPFRLEPGSCNFPSVGHAMLRAGKDEDQTCIFLDYGTYKGVHTHPDVLSIELYALGQLLAPDGQIGYGQVPKFTWNDQTVGHSTLVVDEQSQSPNSGKLNFFSIAPKIRVVDASTDRAYPGVALRRTLVLTNSYLVDLFRASSAQSHRYDWAYHNFGNLAVRANLTPQAGNLGFADGYQEITQVQDSSIGWYLECSLGSQGPAQSALQPFF